MAKNSIELAWEKLDCLEQNGLITGYSVIFYKIIRDYSRINPRKVKSSPSNTITIDRLDPGTKYSMAVAARNAKGVGPYSPKLHVQTRPTGECELDFCRYISICASKTCINNVMF